MGFTFCFWTEAGDAVGPTAEMEQRGGAAAAAAAPTSAPVSDADSLRRADRTERLTLPDGLEPDPPARVAGESNDDVLVPPYSLHTAY
jgi:hypothetical protein